MNFLHTKKFRYGSVSVALTVVIIAAVILFNAIFTALSEKFTWYLDMTSEEMYTLSDEAKGLLDQVFYVVDETVTDTDEVAFVLDRDGKRIPRKHIDTVTGEEKDVEVTIIFCSPKDQMEADTTQRYVLYTVLEMAQEYENIKVKYVDYLTNPSAVSKYKESSGQSIGPYSIIVTSGTQSRVYALSAMFVTDSSDDGKVVGYNGEQRLVSAIHAVTQVETPVACYTTNHGEVDSLFPNGIANGSPLLTLLYETGYDVRPVDLSKTHQTQIDPNTGEEKKIPTDEYMQDCTLILIFDPQTDFLEKSYVNDISEIDKLESFMDDDHSVMVFFDYETPKLPDLEAFLHTWGIEIARHTDAQSGDVSNYLIQDMENSNTADGLVTQASYVETGLGASITRQLRNSKNPLPVLFPYTSAINSTYETRYDDENQYYYGDYYVDGVMRESFDVFTSSESAVAMAGGEVLDDVKGPFSYMKVTRETHFDLETNKTTYSYLLACASTNFAAMGPLVDGGYGNHTVLTRSCHELGAAQLSVSLPCKYFADMEINSITAKQANQYTIVLTVVPATAIFVAGVYIMVRRKYA